MPFSGGSPMYTPEIGFINSAFNPTSLITGNGGFWRADMGVHLSGSNVTQWDDQSSFANNLTIQSSHTDPTFSSTGWLSSKPGITFAGGGTNGQGLNSPALTYNSSTTTGFVLFLYTTNFSFDRVISFCGNGASADYNNAPSFAIDLASTTNVQIDNNNTSTSFGTEATSTAYLLGLVFDGAHITLWKNGTSGSTQTQSGNVGGASTNQFGVGCTGNPGSVSGNSLTGTIAFAGLTQKQMNSTDWGNLKTWSNSNWGTSF